MEQDMNYGKDYKFIPATSLRTGTGQEVVSDLFCETIQIVNLCFVGHPGQSHDWALVDAGMPKSADDIISAAEQRFGSNCRPKAIILTHGHFDHVGAIIELIQHWDVPVFAHELELPYLTGKLSYPEPDTSVEGGLVAKFSALFPNEPINLGHHVEQLPADKSIPGMPGWQWIHTPGHTPGHVSLFRKTDRSLIAGDAFVTVKQESLFNVMTQKQEISGPPRYLTTDWQTAWESVKTLEALKPSAAVTGHGKPMTGKLLLDSLATLANEFDRIAIPDHGKYVDKVRH
jgi:glyoxylase-like metal-dependent hydrolase (beta-lactamase superfamily II)